MYAGSIPAVPTKILTRGNIVEEIKMIRQWLVAGVVCVGMFTSCTIADRYNERVFKEQALQKNMSATEISCAWQAQSEKSTFANCVILANK